MQEKKYNRRLTISLTSEEWQKLQKYAEDNCQTMAGAIRFLINRLLPQADILQKRTFFFPENTKLEDTKLTRLT